LIKMETGKILVPVKGNGSDEEAIKVACSIARKDRCRIYALYVIEVDRSLPLEAEIESEIKRGNQVLTRAAAFADDMDYEIETEIVQSREAGPAIVDEAVEKGIDIIVLGLPYKRRFGQFNLGDTALYVLKNAPCRVLLCRQKLS